MSSTDDEDDNEDEDDIILPNVDIHAKVYAYCTVKVLTIGADTFPQYDPIVHGKPVYVGQTIQNLRERDKQHLSYKITNFDRHYTNPSQYILVILAERRFAAAEKDKDFKDETLHPAGAWMDYWETRYISEFDTYLNGWNRTKGGQGRGWLVTMREAQAAYTFARFRDVYMPAFRDFYKKETHVNAPRSHPILGIPIHGIRRGNTTIPPQFEDELLSMGFDMRNQHIVQRDKRWEEEYMPAFRDFYEDKKHINPPANEPIIGHLVSSIRYGTSSIPPHFEDELFSMGFDMRNQRIVQHDNMWEKEYMPTFRNYYRNKGHINDSTILIYNIRSGNTSIPPQFEEELFSMGFDMHNQHIVQRDKRWEEEYMPAFRDYYKKNTHINPPANEPIIGNLVNNIRTNKSSIPTQFEEELFSMGFDMRNQHIVQHDKRWEEKYMPAFRDYYKKNKHINPTKEPIIGQLVNNIRNGNQVPSRFVNELQRMGLCWHGLNLAMHVQFIIGRTPGSLDTDEEARQVVDETSNIHMRLLTIRSKIKGKDALKEAGLFKIPFGMKPIGDGVARFADDLQKLQDKSKKRKRESLLSE
tara:strand:+ start:266 stop:2014 length:1749 start_codon:yes stop_codon:yes gene_type:complete